jgi:gamma-glutamyltranspeptidase/glutathione hydrolase
MLADLLPTPYASRRLPLTASNGIVATSHPLAAQAGLAMLRAGGNAVDAAIATAAALTVLEPTSNGLGSDAFALIWDGDQLHGLNGSGRAPAGLSLDTIEAAGLSEVPGHGWLPVTVPGAPQLWQDLHERFGALEFSQLLAPAIDYAETGAPVPPIIARNWAAGVAEAQTRPGAEFAPFLTTFAPNGHAPAPGERFISPGHARSLRLMAEQGAQAFYTGEIAAAIAAFARETGGVITADDLAAHRSTWVDPIQIDYRGYSVAEIPPNGQGITALIGLGILEGFDLAGIPRDSAAAYHPQIEAIKLAFADAFRYVADPEHEEILISAMLDRNRLAQRRALIGTQAGDYGPGALPTGGTVYLCAVDRDGCMVSLIQSNFWGFGSGVVVPDWGIALQNRGRGFVTTAGHPNRLAPGKRPYHTIIPGFLLKNGVPVGPFGVMGGHMQPQGHLQVMVNSLDYGMHPQAALDAPRWRWEQDGSLRLELETPRHIVEGLQARGHRVVVETEVGGFGRGQIIWRNAAGDYVAGSEYRCDGAAVGY